MEMTEFYIKPESCSQFGICAEVYPALVINPT